MSNYVGTCNLLPHVYIAVDSLCLNSVLKAMKKKCAYQHTFFNLSLKFNFYFKIEIVIEFLMRHITQN